MATRPIAAGAAARARPVAAGGERRAHAAHLVDDHEQVAVHERGDQRQERAARAAPPARAALAGSVVVAPSSTALTVPIVGLAATAANVARPSR